MTDKNSFLVFHFWLFINGVFIPGLNLIFFLMGARTRAVMGPVNATANDKLDAV